MRFVNINVASFDSVKQGGLSVVADAREAIDALSDALGDYSVSDEYRARTAELAQEWDDDGLGGVPRGRRRQRAEPEPGDRAGEHAVRSARRGGVRGGLDAG